MHLNKTSRRTLLASMPAIAAASLAVGSIGKVDSIEAMTASAAFRDDELDRQVDPINWPATLERAEGVIDRLRNHYGAKWTAADEEGSHRCASRDYAGLGSIQLPAGRLFGSDVPATAAPS
jgi:hypothetical protein